MHNWPNPFIEQRADPYILRHEGQYYFIASVPQYDRLAIRRADSLEGLRDAEEVVVWRKPDTGPMSQLIWAPELHHVDGKWYIYFAATHTQALDALGMFQHRMLRLSVRRRRSAQRYLDGERANQHAVRHLRPGRHHLCSSGQTLVPVGAKSPGYFR